MTRDREGDSSSKSSKHNTKKNLSVTEFLKKQKELVSALKNELKNSNAENQKIKFAAFEQHKCLQDVQKCLKDRDEEIKKLKSELSGFQNENTHISSDFFTIRQKFFELEAMYDMESQKKERNIESLEKQLSTRDSKKEEEVRELTQHCDALVKELHEEKQTYAKLSQDYAEIATRAEKNHEEFVRQQKLFDDYKKHMEEQYNAYNQNANNELNAFKQELVEKQRQFDRQIEIMQGELVEKDELIMQCIKDKDMVEQEKELQIKELNYKISQIGKVFEQPAKPVTPMFSIPNTPQTVHKDQKSAYNVAITKPQQRQQASTSKAAKENRQPNNQLPETSNRLRSKKTPRSSNAANLGTRNTNNIRDIFNDRELLRNPSPPPRQQSRLSSTSTDDDDIVLCSPWNPNQVVPETETDASESFFHPKRMKN